MADFANLVLGVDTSGLKRGERALNDTTRAGGRTERAVKGTAQGFDRAGRSAAMARGDIDRFNLSARATQSVVASARTALSGMAAAFGVGIIISSSISQARAFGTALSEVGTLIDGTAAQTEYLEQTSRQLAATYGGTGTAQAQAFYQAISAGASSVEAATETLEAANRLAIGGVTDVTTAVGVLSTAMNVYASTNLTAAEASDAIFVAVKAGVTTVGELSAALGKVLPLAEKMGLTFDETAAAVAALTKGGLSTAESVTGLRAALAAVLGPSSQAEEIAKRLGINFSASGLEARGFAGFMADVVSSTGGSAEQMQTLFGSVEAVGAALAFSGSAGESMNAILGDMSNKAGATTEAFNKMSEDMQQRLNVVMGELWGLSVSFGSTLLTALVPALEGAAFALGTIADNADILAISIGVLAVTKLPALIASLAATVVWLGTMEGLFIAGAVASRGLAIAMNLIPGVALFTGLTIALTGITRGFSESARAAADFKTAMSSVLDVQNALNTATATYYNEVSRANLEAMLTAAESARDQVKVALDAAKAELEAASFATNFFGVSLAETERMALARAAIEDLSTAYVEAESKLSMAGHAALNFERRLSEAVVPADNLARSVGRLAGQMGAAARNALSFVQNLGNANISGLRAEVASLRGGGSDRDAFEASIRGSDAFQLALTGPVGLADEAIAGLNEELEAFDLRAERAALNADMLGSSVSGAAGATTDTTDALQDQISALEDAADPLRVYNRELAKLDELKLAGLSDGAYAAAVEELADTLRDAEGAADGFASTFSSGIESAFDYVLGGMKQGMDGLLDIFKKTLMDMIKYALMNPINLQGGMNIAGGGSGTGSMGSAVMSGLSSALTAGGSVAGVSGMMAGIGAGAGMAGSALMGGGIGAMGTQIAAQVGTALAGGSMASIGAAIGAVALPLLAVAAVVSFFSSKTKTIDSGIRATIDMEDAMFESFKEIEKSRFWGLSKKRSTSFKALAGEDAAPFETAVFGIQESVIGAMDGLGLSIDALDGFTHEFKVSLKGLDDAAKETAVLDALQGLGDAMADNIVGLSDFALSGEASYATLMRLSTSLATVNDAFRDLGFAAYNVSLAGADGAASFAGLFGSLDNFTASSAAYYDQFYTNDEKLTNATARLGENLAALGIDFIPATNKAFRDLVDTAMLGGDSDLAANLIMLAPAFDAVTDAANTLSDALLAAVNEDAFATGVDFRRGLSRASNGIDYTPKQSQAELMAELRSQNAVMQSTLEIIANSSTQTAENTDYSNALTLDAQV